MKCKEKHTFADYLSAAGVRHTVGRERILEMLHIHGALGADALTKRMRGSIDRVSAYRTLSTFMRAGLVVPVIDAKGATRYELADHHRHYITCTMCGIKEALDACEFAQIEKKALKASKHFVSIQSHAVEFFGTCSRCAN